MNLDQANALRWTAAARGCYEVYYLTLNDLASETGYWIRYVVQAPEITERSAELELWFTFFDRRNPEWSFGAFERRPLATLASRAVPFRLGFNGSPAGGAASRRRSCATDWPGAESVKATGGSGGIWSGRPSRNRSCRSPRRSTARVISPER